MRIHITLLLLLFLVGQVGVCAGKKEIIYVGTFSERGSMGIYVFEFDRSANKYELLQTILSQGSPSFIDVSPNGKFLFSANREGINGKEKWGSVTSFGIDSGTGQLKEIESQYSFGDSPCHLSVHPSGRYIIVSHYKGGNFVVLPINDNGQIGEPTANVQLSGKGTVMPRQDRPHTHSAISSADGRFLYVSDLGLDKILIYEFDVSSGKVKPADQAFIRTIPGSGPRHFAINSKGTFGFSSEEISSSICSYKIIKESGGLQRIQRLPALPLAFFGDNSSADIQLSLDGKIAYVSNRGYNGLAVFKISGNGKMKNIGYVPTIGDRPRGIYLDVKGEFMLVGNRNSDEINIFTVEKNGLLKDTSNYLPVPSPVCIKYLEIQ